MWLENQWDYDRWPDESPRLTWTFSDPDPKPFMGIQTSVRQAGKQIAVFGNHMHGMISSFQIMNEAASPVSSSGSSDHQIQRSHYRENPPRFEPTGRIFDRRGRKRY